MEILNNWISGINDLLWSYVLIIMLLGCAFRFTFKTRFVQFRMFREMIRVLGDSANKAHEGEKHISSFQALMVSTASRVGTGNIAGISTALCIGGPGAMFWMWLTALLGSASAFVESTLAQIYKKRADDGSSYGGPAYYIQAVLKKRWIGILFAVVLIVTYMGGFNMVAAFNIADTFKAYSFYDASMTPKIVGGVLAIAFLICIFGGGKQISKVTGVLVPVMGVFYIAVSLFIVITHINLVPGMIADIVKGVAEGCLQSEAALIGGETAEHPGLMPEEDYDLAGFAVGVCDRKEMITGESLKAGDVLIGMASTGVHSNGFSLVRRVFEQEITKEGLETYYDSLGKTLGEALLAPTRIYVKALKNIKKAGVSIKACSHITGGGFYENVPRMLKDGVRAVIRKDSYEVPAVFKLLAEKGGIAEEMMYNTFNMGIGMIVAADPADVDKTMEAIRAAGDTPYVIGSIEEGEKGVTLC